MPVNTKQPKGMDPRPPKEKKNFLVVPAPVSVAEPQLLVMGRSPPRQIGSLSPYKIGEAYKKSFQMLFPAHPSERGTVLAEL
jgi:hypothetical protein